MAKGRLLFWSFILLLIVAVFAYRTPLFNFFAPRVAQVEKVAVQVATNQITKQVSTPAPLRVPGKNPVSPSAPAAALTSTGIIKQTNVERANNGNLPPLAENSLLDKIANLRMEDMFAKQYFAHVSPASSSAITVAGDVGYDYLALGENLAEGDFKDSKDMVTAWMNSPGHRANILDVHYQQIGVAVREGWFEGDYAWIGVQVFGKPVSACPQVDASLKSNIETSQAQLTEWHNEIVASKADIDSTPDGPERNAKVEQYNTLIAQYNALLNQVQNMIVEYNSEVVALNQCIAN